MNEPSRYVATEPRHLLEGPPGAILVLASESTKGRGRYELDLDPASIPRLAAEHGLDVGGPPAGS